MMQYEELWPQFDSIRWYFSRDALRALRARTEKLLQQQEQQEQQNNVVTRGSRTFSHFQVYKLLCCCCCSSSCYRGVRLVKNATNSGITRLQTNVTSQRRDSVQACWYGMLGGAPARRPRALWQNHVQKILAIALARGVKLERMFRLVSCVERLNSASRLNKIYNKIACCKRRIGKDQFKRL